MRYTVCVDFDGVLHASENPFVSPDVIEERPLPGAVGWLEDMQKRFEVVVMSTRAKEVEGKIAIERWLVAHGPFGGIKATAVKVPALMYVDDRAWRFTGQNFPSPDDVYRALPWHMEERWTRRQEMRSSRD